MTYPEYEGGVYSTGPVIRMRVGNLINARGGGLTGYITSLNFNYDQSVWEMDQEAKLPMMVNISLGFQVLHESAIGLQKDYENSGAHNDLMFGAITQKTTKEESIVYGKNSGEIVEDKSLKDINVQPDNIEGSGTPAIIEEQITQTSGVTNTKLSTTTSIDISGFRDAFNHEYMIERVLGDTVPDPFNRRLNKSILPEQLKFVVPTTSLKPFNPYEGSPAGTLKDPEPPDVLD